MIKIIKPITLLLFVLLTNKIISQEVKIKEPIDSTKTYRVELVDESVFVGNIIQKDSIRITMKTLSIPKVEMLISEIKKLDELDDSNFVDGKYWFPNPHSTRYLFSPSAFNLKGGEGYYQNTYLFLNSFNVGLMDNFSVGGGFEIISTFSGEPIFFITPKVSFEVSEKFHAGGGILYVSVPEFDDDDARSSLGITYGIATYGSPDHNVTCGMGWGFVNGEFSEKPIITLSGMTRIAKKTALVTENWFIPSDDNYYGLFSYGIRFFGESMSVDLAFLNNSDIAEGIAIGIPYVSFAVNF